MRLIVGISGASGAIIGCETLRVLHGMADVETHLVATEGGIRMIKEETPYSYEDACAFADCVHDDRDLGALISSGSFVTSGMVIAPCSMKSLSALAHGYDASLLVRAADVCLKERRSVVLLPREMPLNRTHLKNMLACADAGCCIIPPVLTFYNNPESIGDQIRHIIAKSLMQFGIDVPGFKAWQGFVG